MGKGGGEIFKKAKLKRFFYDMGYGISVWKSPFSILLQVRLQDSFLTSNKQPRSDTCSSDLPQQKTGSGCRINKKKNISLSSGELSFSQHITRCCVMTELQNNTNMSAASILPRRKTGQKCFEGFGKKKFQCLKELRTNSGSICLYFQFQIQ